MLSLTNLHKYDVLTWMCEICVHPVVWNITLTLLSARLSSEEGRDECPRKETSSFPPGRGRDIKNLASYSAVLTQHNHLSLLVMCGCLCIPVMMQTTQAWNELMEDGDGRLVLWTCVDCHLLISSCGCGFNQADVGFWVNFFKFYTLFNTNQGFCIYCNHFLYWFFLGSFRILLTLSHAQQLMRKEDGWMRKERRRMDDWWTMTRRRMSRCSSCCNHCYYHYHSLCITVCITSIIDYPSSSSSYSFLSL